MTAQPPYEPLSITEVDRDFIFLTFALTEAANAIRLLEKIERLAMHRERVNEQVERREFASVLQAIRLALHFAGSVSRIFWPTGRTRAAGKSRCERLRALLDLSEHHPLSKRSLRDDMEHLDERLDAWTEISPRPFTWVEAVVNSDEDIKTVEAIEKSTLVIYFEESNEVRILGNTYQLTELRKNLIDIRDRISNRSA